MFRYVPRPVRSVLRYSVVSRCIGLLLLGAAILKLNGLRIDAVPSIGVLSVPEVRFGLIEFEIFLGVWMLSGKAAVGSWLTAIITFVAFAWASGYQAWIGQASCGCFGRLSHYVRPWHAFTLDVSVLVVLGLFRPDLSGFRTQPWAALRRAVTPLALGAFGVAAVLGLLSLSGRLAFGSTDAALAHLRGERLSLRPMLIDLGTGTFGELHKANVTIANYTDHTVRIIGGTSDCSCLTTHDLPVTLEPGEAKSIVVWIALPGNAGILTRRGTLLTDDTDTPSIAFRITARIVAMKKQASVASAGR